MGKKQTTVSFYLQEKAFFDELQTGGLTSLTFTQFVKEAFYFRISQEKMQARAMQLMSLNPNKSLEECMSIAKQEYESKGKTA